MPITKERGCGSRKKGGIYLTVPESPFGSPLEHFIVNPPKIVDLQTLGLSPRGISLVKRDGLTHVFDVVGSEHYPNVADFIEEAKVLGVSRRAELNDYSALTPASRLILIHRRAWIDNWPELFAQLSEAELARFNCPSPYEDIYAKHMAHKGMCAGLWWMDVEGMQQENEAKGCRVEGMRTLPCGAEYRGSRADCNFFPEYKYAIFASFPLGSIEVVKDADDEAHKAKIEKAERSQLQVDLVES